jgi:hypothetical protein
VTVTNTGADLQDVATIIGRTQGTKEGGAAAGSAGMLAFDGRMAHPEAAAGDATALSYHNACSRPGRCKLRALNLAAEGHDPRQKFLMGVYQDA